MDDWPGKTHPMRDAITDVAGIKVGHWTDRRRATGLTVVLTQAGATPGYHQPGGAPGTVDTDLLRPENMIQQIHAVLLTGGSAMGLESAAGVRAALRGRDVGLRLRFTPKQPTIPIVVGAVVFDLGLGNARAFPRAAAGRAAVERATGGLVAEGSVGVGTGCTVGKALGAEHALKGGVGTASVVHESGLVVGALAAVNAAGDVHDPDTGALLAGPRGGRRGQVRSTADILLEKPLAQYREDAEAMRAALRGDGSVSDAPTSSATTLNAYAPANTTLVVVATNARLDKAQATRLAVMANDGLSRAVRPSHTPGDGDVIFTLATSTLDSVDIDATPRLLSLLGVMAAQAAGRAIVRGVLGARGLAGVPGVRQWRSPRVLPPV